MMIKHYLTSTIRQSFRQKSYTAIAVIGLAIGMACFLITMSWLRYEASFDTQLQNGDRIVRIVGKQEFAAGDYMLAPLPYNLAPALSQEFSEFEQVARVQAPSSLLFAVGEKRFYESSVFYADSNIFEVFRYTLIQGDRTNALSGPDKAVVSSAIAEKYFGNDSPIGRTIRLDNRVDLTVTGVLEPLPYNLSFRPEILVTMSTHAATAAGTYLHDWRTNAYATFALIRNGVDHASLETKIGNFLTKFRPDGTPPQLKIQPVRDIHLAPNLQSDYGVRRSKVVLWMFGLTALFVLAIGCVNYTNLATARAISRDREIGVRKALGANRSSLLAQFFGESMIVSGAAMALALVLSEFIVICGNRWYGAQMDRYYNFDPVTLGIVIAIWLLVAIGAGAYPALYLSSLRPASAIRSIGTGVLRSSILRGVLVVLQFIISIALIIGTITVYRQLVFFTERDLGFDRDLIVTVPLAGQELKDRVPELKTALKSNPAVRAVTAMGALPSSVQQSSASFNWEGGPPDQQLLFNLNVVDPDYLETFGISLAAGRNFLSEEPASETSMPCIINETAAARMGWADAVGRNIIQPPDLKINVVGVVKDYNYASLHVPIRPLMLYMDPSRPTNLAIKIATTDIEKTLNELERSWSSILPERPFNYSFLDESFAATYQSEQLAARILLMYTILAIVIACLGLISLASYRIAKRTKETGIRKVLGASVNSLVFLHIREFIIWVVVANAVAWPISYFAMQKWLQNFAFRVEIAWWSMAVAGIAVLVFSILTVATQTIKAATNNPVTSLRYE